MAKIAIYNVDKKELVGLFSGPAFAGRYLYAGVYSLKKCQKLSSASRIAARLRDKPKGYTVAVRKANQAQIKLLGELDFILMDNYQDKIQMPMRNNAREFHKIMSERLKSKVVIS